MQWLCGGTALRCCAVQRCSTTYTLSQHCVSCALIVKRAAIARARHLPCVLQSDSRDLDALLLRGRAYMYLGGSAQQVAGHSH